MAASIQHCVPLGGFRRASPNGSSRFAGGWTARKLGAFQGGSGLQATSAIEDIKMALRSSLTGTNRGIFGVQTPKRVEIEGFIKNLESMNPCHEPTENLEKLEGDWQLLYSTISILGSKRTKLGLRDFISFGQFLQRIDVKQSKAVNVIAFNVPALGMLKGSLTISASYNISSPTRVNIEYESSSIVPAQLMSLFQKNYDLLLSIFNPAGWLEITYVDESWRIGRDDKGNIFLVEKVEQRDNSNATQCNPGSFL